MKKIILIILGVALLNTGCDKIDFGDVNDNKNGAKDVNTASLMQGAMMRYGTLTGRPYRLTPSLYVQWLTQRVYVDEMLYADVPGNWDNYYSQLLSNLDLVIETCEDESYFQDSIVTGNMNNQIQIARIFKAYVFKHVTDCFGDVPYSEALDENIKLPKFDSQQSIYTDLISEVIDARNKLHTATIYKVSGDPFFGGASVTVATQIDRWQRFANSFLLQLTLQLSKKYPAAGGFAATNYANAITYNKFIETNAQEFWYTYDILGGFNSPWAWMRSADYSVSTEFLQSMRGSGALKRTSNVTTDDRAKVMATNAAAVGLAYGLATQVGTATSVSTLTRASTSKFPLMTAAYTYLNRAEGAARGWSAEVAATMLSNGIAASYSSLQVNLDPTNGKNIGASAAAYATARVADAGTAAGGILQVIGEEKWVALWPDAFTAWSEWRRTGYPTLVPAADAYNDGNIPRRYNYPSAESSLNPTNYQDALTTLVPATDNNTSRFWWDQ